MGESNLDLLMFDDMTLKSSKFYFSMLQLLRIIETWVLRTRRDMTSWVPLVKLSNSFKFNNDHKTSPEERETFWKEVNPLIEKELSSYDSLLQRIRAKQEELQTLRDGVSIYLRIVNLRHKC